MAISCPSQPKATLENPVPGVVEDMVPPLSSPWPCRHEPQPPKPKKEK